MIDLSFIKTLIWIVVMVLLLEPTLERSLYMFSQSKDIVAVLFIILSVILAFMYYREGIKKAD